MKRDLDELSARKIGDSRSTQGAQVTAIDHAVNHFACILNDLHAAVIQLCGFFAASQRRYVNVAL
jgi:hypothetical protein